MVTGVAKEQLPHHGPRKGDCRDILLGGIASVLRPVELLEDGVDLSDDPGERSD